MFEPLEEILPIFEEVLAWLYYDKKAELYTIVNDVLDEQESV